MLRTTVCTRPCDLVYPNTGRTVSRGLGLLQVEHEESKGLQVDGDNETGRLNMRGR